LSSLTVTFLNEPFFYGSNNEQVEAYPSFEELDVINLPIIIQN